MRLFLDDVRPIPSGWVGAKTQREAESYLESGQVQEISFDHDLGPEANGTGHGVACFIEKMAFEGRLAPIGWRVHSSNPVGRKAIESVMAHAERIWERYGMQGGEE